MNTDLITEISQAVVTQQLLLNWHFYFILIAIYGLVFFVQNWLGAVLKGKGERFATKSDFDQILEQLKVTTAAAKSIEVSLSHNDWTLKEFKTVRRIKLEEVMTALYTSLDWLESMKAAKFFKGVERTDPSPIDKFRIVCLLYFPELKALAWQIYTTHQSVAVSILSHAQKFVTVQHEIDGWDSRPQTSSSEAISTKIAERTTILETALAEILKLQEKFLSETNTFGLQAVEIMRTVIEVDSPVGH